MCKIFCEIDMDEKLFASVLKDLLLDNDRVAVPGFGSFIASEKPAFFSEDGRKIFPPGRCLEFRFNETWNDGLMESRIAALSGIGIQEAKKRISDFVFDLRKSLSEEKFYIIDSLGVLRQTNAGKIYFSGDRNMDIDPSSFALEALHVSPKEGRITETVSQSCSVTETEVEELPVEAEVPVLAVDKNESVVDKNESVIDNEESVADTDSVSENREEAEVKKTGDVGHSLSDGKIPEVAVEAKSDMQESESGNAVDTLPSDNEKAAKHALRRKVVLAVLSVVCLLAAIVVIAFVFRDEISAFWSGLIYSDEELELIRKYDL